MATVLVIDDDPQMNALLCQILETAGCKVLAAHNGVAAIEILKANDISLIVTDILMPGMDGMEIILKMKFQHTAPPIIAISGGGKYHGAGECLSWASNLGIPHTFKKPIDRKKFLQKVRELMKAD